ncbi:septal ring lytic transglycosylase RlpA family protein [Planosporangium sp. 12N6]|uniref:septal ring lytic transglycosylase RlpA family protein n=1 Tax=Planosporangium spinosum TaxID=3402278 RepID=UPI003CF1C59A
MITGTTVAALGLNPVAHTADAALPTAAPSDRTQARADRGEQRAEPSVEATPSAVPSAAPTSASPSPSLSPTAKPTPKPTKSATQAPKPPSGGGSVVSSGSCQASFYTDEGSRTANGETFHTADFTAAHKTLPFNTRVRVTNVTNGKSVVVRINDRGPFVSGRCLDLTPAAFNTISSTSAGVATVSFEVLQG